MSSRTCVVSLPVLGRALRGVRRAARDNRGVRLSDEEARARFGAARVARLATASGDGQPHVVPVTFAVDGDLIFTAVDHKPKTTVNLRRLRNIGENPRVAVLADDYADDWETLWWVRVDGRASVLENDDRVRHQLDMLAERYEQYRQTRPTGPVIVIEAERWTGWAGALERLPAGRLAGAGGGGSVAAQDLAVGGGGVGVGNDLPAEPVDADLMMIFAQEFDISHAGRAALGAGDQVVALAGGRGPGAPAGPGAVPVAEDDRAADVRRDVPGAAHVQRQAAGVVGGVQQPGAQVAGQPAGAGHRVGGHRQQG